MTSRAARAAQRLDRQVEARQRAVDLERGAGLLGGGEDRVDVEIDGRAAADHARREVADHAHRRIVHRRHDALGLRGAIELEVVVHRGEAPVEGAAELEVVVELAVGADVQLDAVEEAQRVAELRLQRADPRALLEERLAPDARERALGVIGDGQDAVAARLRRGDHLLERRAAVARHRGVHVEVADALAPIGRGSVPFSAASISPPSSRRTGGMNGRPSAS